MKIIFGSFLIVTGLFLTYKAGDEAGYRLGMDKGYKLGQIAGQADAKEEFVRRYTETNSMCLTKVNNTTGWFVYAECMVENVFTEESQ